MDKEQNCLKKTNCWSDFYTERIPAQLLSYYRDNPSPHTFVPRTILFTTGLLVRPDGTPPLFLCYGGKALRSPPGSRVGWLLLLLLHHLTSEACLPPEYGFSLVSTSFDRWFPHFPVTVSMPQRSDELPINELYHCHRRRV